MAQPLNLEVTDSSSELIFFYDTLSRKIVYANAPVEHFFGFSLSLQEGFPFYPGSINAGNEMELEWQKCLTLGNMQAHSFNYTVKESGGSNTSYLFNASGISMKPMEGSSLLLCIVKRRTQPKVEDPGPRPTELYPLMEKVELIDLAAHDLDAPLRKLGVLIEMLTGSEDLSPSKKLEYSNRITRCLGEMRSLIDSLATFSKVGTNTRKLQTVNLNAVCEKLIKEFGKELGIGNSDISVGVLGSVEGDGMELQLLFKELLRNALTYQEGGNKPEIRIFGEAISPEEQVRFGLIEKGNYIKIVVSDNGIGFHNELAEKIFQPFVQLHGKSAYGGNGIGLAMCRKIVENQGGFIYAESREKKGSRFILIIPQN